MTLLATLKKNRCLIIRPSLSSHPECSPVRPFESAFWLRTLHRHREFNPKALTL